eukprot:40517-Pelagomonas_calceolata.AAC.1
MECVDVALVGVVPCPSVGDPSIQGVCLLRGVTVSPGVSVSGSAEGVRPITRREIGGACSKRSFDQFQP